MKRLDGTDTAHGTHINLQLSIKYVPPPGFESGAFISSLWRSPSWAIVAVIFLQFSVLLYSFSYELRQVGWMVKAYGTSLYGRCPAWVRIPHLSFWLFIKRHNTTTRIKSACQLWENHNIVSRKCYHGKHASCIPGLVCFWPGNLYIYIKFIYSYIFLKNF